VSTSLCLPLCLPHKAKLLKERVPPPPRTVQSFFTLPPPVLSARVQALVSLADVVKQAPVQHAQPAPYNKIGRCV
jgi:hypothetical protein